MSQVSQAHRQLLKRLRGHELELGDAQRSETARLRQAEMDAKAASVQSRASEPIAAPRHEGAHAPNQPNPPAKRPGRAAANLQSAASAVEQRHASEERNEAAFNAKARNVDTHRAAVIQRNAERAAKGKVAAPLPLPQLSPEAGSGSSASP